MGTQRLSNLWVRAGHTYGDPGPVANMAPGRREHLDRGPLNPLADGGQVADHTRWLVGQSKLHRPVQIHDDIAEPAGSSEDDYLTDDACSDLSPRSRGRATS